MGIACLLSDGEESACNAGDPGSIPGWWRFPWRREWLPTPVFLPGEFNGQRSLVGCSPWGCKESDTTEWLTLSEDIRNYLKQQQQQQNTILMRHIFGMNSLYKQVKSLSLDFMLFLWSNICPWKVCICVCICVPAVTAWSILRIKRHICYSQWWGDLNRNHTWRTHVPTWIILWEISRAFGFFGLNNSDSENKPLGAAIESYWDETNSLGTG